MEILLLRGQHIHFPEWHLINHMNSQTNALRVGGLVGLTEDPAVLQRWILAGPEIA